MSKELSIHNVKPEELKQWVDQGRAIIVDVREPSEHSTEHIKDSLLNPISAFDYYMIPEEAGKKIVFHCKSGNRSRLAAGKWMEFKQEDAYHLEGGITAWKSVGYETCKS